MRVVKFALRARLLYAAQLLVSTDPSVADVAERPSFTDGSHFAAAFRKHVGEQLVRYSRKARAATGIDYPTAGTIPGSLNV